MGENRETIDREVKVKELVDQWINHDYKDYFEEMTEYAQNLISSSRLSSSELHS